MARAWRIARSVSSLITQANTVAPRRNRSSDGTIGDAAHSRSKSEHNPDAAGIVRAVDLTHDPRGGFDAHAAADAILRAQDRRLLYVISNRRIGSGPAGRAPGQWRRYTGSNPHTKHAHTSVVAGNLGDTYGLWAGVGGVKTGSVYVARPSVVIAPHASVRLPELHRNDLSAGNTGWVQLVQKCLRLPVDGLWEARTDAAVRAQQRRYGLRADGWVGGWTWASFIADAGTELAQDEAAGHPGIEVLQNMLGLSGADVDGDGGPLTFGHVRAVQSWSNLRPDAIVGAGTRRVLALR